MKLVFGICLGLLALLAVTEAQRCRNGMEYTTCKMTNCRNTCDNPTRASQPRCQRSRCRRGCQCPDDKPLWSIKDRMCVAADDCPVKQQCSGGMEWSMCASPCGPRTCTQQNIFCKMMCYPGCACPRSKPILQNGVCISESDCPAPVNPCDTKQCGSGEICTVKRSLCKHYDAAGVAVADGDCPPVAECYNPNPPPPPMPIDACMFMTCPAGQSCVIQTTDNCFVPPCEVPVCVGDNMPVPNPVPEPVDPCEKCADDEKCEVTFDLDCLTTMVLTSDGSVSCGMVATCHKIDNTDPCAKCRPDQRCQKLYMPCAVGDPGCEQSAVCHDVDPCASMLCVPGTMCVSDGLTAKCIRDPMADLCATMLCMTGTVCESDGQTAKCIPDPNHDPCQVCSGDQTCEMVYPPCVAGASPLECVPVPVCHDKKDPCEMCGPGTRCELKYDHCNNVDPTVMTDAGPCTPSVTCHPEIIDPCATMDCGPGMECVAVDVQCVMSPCPPMAECRPTDPVIIDPCMMTFCGIGEICQVQQPPTGCMTANGEMCPPEAVCVPLNNSDPSCPLDCPPGEMCQLVPTGLIGFDGTPQTEPQCQATMMVGK